MGKQEYIECCERISEALFMPGIDHPYAEDIENDLQVFIYEITEENDAAEKVSHDLHNGKLMDTLDEAISNVFKVALSIGYTIGQMIDIPYPQAQADIDAIKQVIREKGLLPYVPRERRAP